MQCWSYEIFGICQPQGKINELIIGVMYFECKYIAKSNEWDILLLWGVQQEFQEFKIIYNWIEFVLWMIMIIYICE